MGRTFPVFFILVALSMVAMIVVGNVRARARREEVATGASARGWTYREDWPGLEDHFAGEPFHRGGSRSVRNVVEGVADGRSFIAFDYSYTTRSGGVNDDSSTTHRFSVIALDLGFQVPMLQVRPEGSFGAFFTKLFGADLQLGDPVFDEAFHVTTVSPEFAFDVLDPAVRHQMLALRERTWRFEGTSFLLVGSGRLHAMAEVDAVLAQGRDLLAAVPERVWMRLRTDGIQDAPG